VLAIGLDWVLGDARVDLNWLFTKKAIAVKASPGPN